MDLDNLAIHSEREAFCRVFWQIKEIKIPVVDGSKEIGIYQKCILLHAVWKRV